MEKLGFKGMDISFTADYLSKEYTFPFSFNIAIN